MVPTMDTHITPHTHQWVPPCRLAFEIAPHRRLCQEYVKGEKGWKIVSGEGTDQEVSKCLNCEAVHFDLSVGPYERKTKLTCRAARRQSHIRSACQHPVSYAQTNGRKNNSRTTVRKSPRPSTAHLLTIY